METASDPLISPTFEGGGAIVDELLLQIETAETVEERDRWQAELDELVANDPEAARTYQGHCLLEKELRALFESPCFKAEREKSPIRSFFRRLRNRFWPGPVG